MRIQPQKEIITLYNTSVKSICYKDNFNSNVKVISVITFMSVQPHSCGFNMRLPIWLVDADQ